MKNLNSFVEKVWAELTIEGKLAAFKTMIDASHGSKMKKYQTLQQAESCSMEQLDYLAVNYAMVGDGLGVIKIK